MNAKALLSARKNAMADGKKALRSSAGRREALRARIEARRNAIQSKAEKPAEKKAVVSGFRARRDEILSKRSAMEARRNALASRKEAVRSRIEKVEAVKREKLLASRNEAKLRQMHADEERKRLFQNSQAVMNEERIAIRQGANRNSAALDKMYNGLF